MASIHPEAPSASDGYGPMLDMVTREGDQFVVRRMRSSATLANVWWCAAEGYGPTEQAAREQMEAMWVVRGINEIPPRLMSFESQPYYVYGTPASATASHYASQYASQNQRIASARKVASMPASQWATMQQQYQAALQGSGSMFWKGTLSSTVPRASAPPATTSTSNAPVTLAGHLSAILGPLGWLF